MNNLSVIYLPKFDNIKVVENISGKERTYYINIKNKGIYFKSKKIL